VPTLLGVGLVAAFLVSMPWVTLMSLGVIYLASIPLSYYAYRELDRQRRPEDFVEIEEPSDTPLF